LYFFYENIYIYCFITYIYYVYFTIEIKEFQVSRENAYAHGIKKFINKKLTYTIIVMQYMGGLGGVVIIIHICLIDKWVVRNA